MNRNYKVSFCITCKDRLHHLRETLQQNLANNKNYPNTEFVILDYDSPDGLEAWVKENFKREIASGKILYAKYAPAPDFKFSHAKNLAHRLATGDIVCNLDADNLTAPGFARWLNERFSRYPESYVRPDRAIIVEKTLCAAKYPKGVSGRIAMLKEKFLQLRGYDESYQAWGDEDNNLEHRARLSGLNLVKIPYRMLGDAILHTDDERMKHLDNKNYSIAQDRLERYGTLGSKASRLLHIDRAPAEVPPPANPDGNFGCGTVRINFGREIRLKPCAAAAPAGGSRKAGPAHPR